jgi:hypothetical protein
VGYPSATAALVSYHSLFRGYSLVLYGPAFELAIRPVGRVAHGDPATESTDAVAREANYPVIEVDLIARNNYYVKQKKEFQERMTDPSFYSTKEAGQGVWGQSCWIGAGWCATHVN